MTAADELLVTVTNLLDSANHVLRRLTAISASLCCSHEDAEQVRMRVT